MKKIIAILSIALIFASCQNNVSSDQPSASPAEFQEIQTSELKEKIDDGNWVIVDTRLNDSYNGWVLEEEARGGHIKNAVDFSANWLNVKTENIDKQLDDALNAKGITKEKNIILYDANGNDSKLVADFLKSKGFTNIYLYNVLEWAKDSSLPMEKYDKYELIVPAKIVKEVIDGKKPESFENATTIKIVESSWGEQKESFDNGHIPTAFHINTDSFEPPPTWMLDKDENLAKWALTNGFNKDDTVIVTGQAQMASYRLAVVLRYIGVSDVRVLNGGDSSWVQAGYELEKDSHSPVASTDFGAPIPKNPDVIVTIKELKEFLPKTDEYVLVDNRGYDEYIGESSGYSYHDKKGRIPGAVYGYAGTSGSGSLDFFRNPDNTMKNKDEILALWKNQEIDLNKNLMFMCGSGWRAAEVLYYAQVAGLENTSLYSDGWIGWSNDPKNPIETGAPKK